MIDDFLIRAGLAGIGVALATGPLGAFVVWRRMAYFGDATAHGAILGVVLALGMDLPINLGTLAVALAMSFAILLLTRRGHGTDAALGVLSHGMLALGLVAFSIIGNGQAVSLDAFLFGDILLVSKSDLFVIWGGALAVIGVMVWRWQGLLISTLNPELARSSGINPGTEHLGLTLALAIVVAVSLKVVGALLIGAMLIIPASAARNIAKSPEAMAAFAVVIGMISAIGGLAMSWFAQTPAGPSIVCVALAQFVLSLGFRYR